MAKHLDFVFDEDQNELLDRVKAAVLIRRNIKPKVVSDGEALSAIAAEWLEQQYENVEESRFTTTED